MSEVSFSSLESNRSEADRAAIYAALVACEIALKSALESAGFKLAEIPKTHNLAKLLKMVSSCTVLISTDAETKRSMPASRLRGIIVDPHYSNATVGNLLQGEKFGASVFPNEIRYGRILRHFPAMLICKLSSKVIEWVNENEETINFSSDPRQTNSKD
jgi:HEPN domain-containing protein